MQKSNNEVVESVLMAIPADLLEEVGIDLYSHPDERFPGTDHHRASGRGRKYIPPAVSPCLL